MKTITVLLLSVLTINVYSQFDDLLKKLPGVNELIRKSALTTSIKDAYPVAFWLNDFDAEIKAPEKKGSFRNIRDGFYRLKLKSFCLKAGGWEPTEGDGYLIAPMKGLRADLIKNIITKYADNPTIDQKDVQRLIWGIEAGMKFSDFPPDVQLRVTPLLNPEDIAMMEVNLFDVSELLLPDEAKQVLRYYEELRGKIKDAGSTYEDIERVAVRTGMAPLGKGSINIEKGSWTLIKGGYFVRTFPFGYKHTTMEVYKPAEVKITRDDKKRITFIESGTSLISFEYADGSDILKSGGKNSPILRIKRLVYTGPDGQVTLDDKAWYIPQSYKPSSKETGVYPSEGEYSAINASLSDFSRHLKKFSKKYKSSVSSNESAEIKELRSIELVLKNIVRSESLNENVKQNLMLLLTDITAYSMVSSLENLNSSGGQSDFSFEGLLAAPGNTSNQRIGISGTGEEGEGGEEEEDEPEIILHQVNSTYLPSPGTVFTAQLEINSEKPVEEIIFDLYDISRENGRCLNDKDPEFFKSPADADMIFDPSVNTGYDIGATSSPDWFTATGSGSAPRQIAIQSRDYGGFAKLKARVRIDGNWYSARCEGWGRPYVKVPFDMNDNNIADAWENDNGTASYEPAWDEEADPSGQLTNGDGISRYEEYRGFYIFTAEMSSEHLRTNPVKKELFVIDPDNLLSIIGWKTASGIDVYKLNTEMVYGSMAGSDEDPNYRWVNFCRGNAQGQKYAINLVKVDGLTDPYGHHPGIRVFGYCPYGPPILVMRAVMFPDRIERWLLDERDSLVNVLARFPTGETITYGTRPWPRTFLQTIVEIINNESNRFLLQDFMMNYVVIHELGHGCKIPHHGSGVEGLEGTGDATCVMRYYSIRDQAETFYFFMSQVMDLSGGGEVLPVLSYRNWIMCRTPDNCWSKLTINDRTP